MVKAIPDRWLNYRPIGERIAGTRFIAFKVPLRKNINDSVDDEQLRLAPHTLLESVPNLGLIVDLTNTNRYYNPQTFMDLNVAHQKLMIPGHQTPTKELAQRFCDYVTDFLDANPDNDKLIGVHCTHGVNRTGYLICYFMITKMNISPKLAIQTFADARGHKIERENYTESLQLLKSEQGLRKLLSETSRSPNRRHSKRRLTQSHDDRRVDRSVNWRDRHQEQISWQPAPSRNQWRNTNTYRSQEDGPPRRPPQREMSRWRQASPSEAPPDKTRRYNDYHSDNSRYQPQVNWRPRQIAGQRDRGDQGFAYNSSSRSSSYNNNFNNNNNNFNNNNNNNNNFSNYRRNNYSSRSENNDNYSRRSNYSRSHNNHNNHCNPQSYRRENSRSNSNRFRCFESD